jgi:hypothetical protein
MQLGAKVGAITSALALTAGISMVFAAPALAVDHQDLCVVSPDGIQCAQPFSTGTPPVGTSVAMGPTTALGKFDVPGTFGQISVYGSSPKRCLEVTDSTDGTVQLESCSSNLDEEWSVFGAPGDTSYYENALYTGLCLNDKYYDKVINAADCGDGSNENQNWYASPPT